MRAFILILLFRYNDNDSDNEYRGKVSWCAPLSLRYFDTVTVINDNKY